MIRRILTATWCALVFLGCDGWELVAREEPSDAKHPFRLTVLSMESCPLPSHLNSKNVTLLSYKVRLEGKHVSRVPANYFYGTAITSDGKRYLSTHYGCSPLLSASPLRENESAVGFINFSVPPSSTVEKLVYAPELMGLSKDASSLEVALNHTTLGTSALESDGK